MLNRDIECEDLHLTSFMSDTEDRLSKFQPQHSKHKWAIDWLLDLFQDSVHLSAYHKMANLTDTSTSQCNFTTIENFFDYATEHSLNITAQIEHCPDLCLLTFGIGNPDLSGIGVSGPPISLPREYHRD